MKILYTVLGNLGNLSSGSGLRQSCMYQAFLERGHTVYVLSGYEGRGEGKLRRAEVEKAMAWAEENHPDLCYIESSVYPMLHGCDYEWIRFLSRKKIPTAYFYRDFYHKFPAQFPKRKGLINRLKDGYLDFLRWRTDSILHKIRMVYFPSTESCAYFPYRNMKALQPAGEVNFLKPHANNRTCIYVGGISQRYGFRLMMDAFELLNQGEEEYRLILVCRDFEYQKADHPDPEPSWLEVHHVSGKDLEPLYARSDLSLIALEPNPYADVAICIKLFQYLSYGLPVLSTDVTAMTAIIRENGFGEVAPYDAERFAAAIRRMLERDEVIESYRESVEKNMSSSNLWVHRVDQIIEDLLGSNHEK